MRVTLRDIASRVHLSHATVSFVLNGRMDVSIPGPTRERVLQAAKEMGYRPNRAAQALVRGRTHMVALWLPFAQSAHHARVQLEFAELVTKDGFKLVTRLFDFGRAKDGNTWEIDDWPVDGVLLLDCDEPSNLDFAALAGIPLVSLGTVYDPVYDHVGVNIATGMREAMTHLTSEGCRRIAYVTCRKDHSREPKLVAYLAECDSRNLAPELITAPACSRIDACGSVGAHVATHGKPDAILAQSDELAIAACRGLRDCGLVVPADVLIIGCDGTEEGEFASPSITSILQPDTEMASKSWTVLRSRIADIPTDRTSGLPTHSATASLHAEILEARLMIRESSVRPA